jgi:hypothetical protein
MPGSRENFTFTYQIKEADIDGACDTYGGESRNACRI